MATPEVLRREIKALAFDQYGTIVDMQTGLTEAVTPFLKRKGWDGKPNSFVTWWRRTHFENSMIDALLDRGHTPYRQIGHRAVSYVMDRCGLGAGRVLYQPPKSADADLRLQEVFVAHSNRPEHAAGGGLLEAVGDVAAAGLDVRGR